MGRSAKSLDKSDFQEVLSMKDEFLSQQQSTTDLRADVNLLKADVVSIHSSQGEISEQVGDVQKAVLDLGKQLAAMSSVLKTLQPQSSRNAEKQPVTEDLEHVKSPTLQQGQLEQHNTRTEVLRKQMELEKELNRHCESVKICNSHLMVSMTIHLLLLLQGKLILLLSINSTKAGRDSFGKVISRLTNRK